MQVTAEWRYVPGYMDILQASNDGQLRTVDRQTASSSGKPRWISGKLLSQCHNNGRLACYFRHAGKVHAVPVANAVAAAFIRELRPNEIMSWKDGNRNNNDVTNLEIVVTPRTVSRKTAGIAQ